MSIRMIEYLIGKYQAAKREYLNRSPRGKWIFVRNIGIIGQRLVGIDILDPNFKFWWLSFSPALIVIDTTTSFIYTFWKFMGDDIIKGVVVAPLYLGVVIPCITSYSFVIFPSNTKIFQSLAFFAGEKIYKEKGNAHYMRVCDQCAMKLLKDTSIIMVIILGSFAVFMGFPMYALIYQHDLQMPVPLLLPFTDIESTSWIVVNLIHQFAIALFGVPSVCTIEITTCMMKNNVWACVLTMSYSIDELSESLEKNALKIPLVHGVKFRNLLIQAQDLDRFVLGLADIYYWRFLLQPPLMAFSISLALFFYMFADWISGIGAAFLLYSQLYILCNIGNDVDLAKQHLLLKFHELPWYLLTRDDQLKYAHMLNRIQNGAVLRIGPFAELNFETFSDMTKRIYSFLMMLLKFMK